MNEPFSTFKISLIIASLLGWVVSLKYLRPTATMTERIVSFIWACAWTFYATPAIITYFKLENGSESIIAFSLGIFFMQIVDIWMHLLDTYRKDPSKLLEAIARLKR